VWTSAGIEIEDEDDEAGGPAPNTPTRRHAEPFLPRPAVTPTRFPS
jgi:hypothetical protein